MFLLWFRMVSYGFEWFLKHRNDPFKEGILMVSCGSSRFLVVCSGFRWFLMASHRLQTAILRPSQRGHFCVLGSSIFLLSTRQVHNLVQNRWPETVGPKTVGPQNVGPQTVSPQLGECIAWPKIGGPRMLAPRL